MKYVNSGALFSRKKSSDKAPDMGGDILLTQELLDSLPRDADGDLTLSVSGWVRQSPKGEFISLKASAPWNGGAKPQPKKEIVEDDIADPWA
jgi:hypothetical protein